MYLSQRFPYPPDRGDRIPVFNHIKHLSRAHQVHVVSPLAAGEELRHLAAMEEWAASITCERHPRWLSFLGKVFAFLTARPLSLGHFRNRRLLKKVRDLVEREGIEAAVIFSSSMAQYVQPFGTMIRIMNFCDLDSQKWADLAPGAPWIRRWIYRREADLLLEYERKIAASFSSSCVVTENEAELFRKLIPGVPVQVLANGVDHDYFGAIERRPVGLRLAFVGVMDYAPNVEAVEFFCREVWPQVLFRHPSARFSIVGSRPNRRVTALAGVAGVTVTGLVPDVRAYLAAATMVVVPLKVARGIQNKVLEAMAAGVPVLATPASIAGLPESAREVLFIADRSERGAFLSKISEMLDNRQTMEARAKEAQAFVRAHYSWENSGRILEGLLFEAKAARNAAYR